MNHQVLLVNVFLYVYSFININCVNCLNCFAFFFYFEEPLYELLLSISSSCVYSGEKSLAAAASSCLLSLVLAWGVTPKIFQALNHLVTAAHQPLATQQILVNTNSFINLLFRL